jgi:hypothetical protein
MKVKHAALVQALTGRFGDHHGELARMLLDSYDALTAQIGTLTSRIEELIAAIPEARGVDAGGATGPGAGEGPDAAVRSAIARLDEIPGVGRHTAQVILAETGLDMARFPTAAHLVSWAKLSRGRCAQRQPQRHQWRLLLPQPGWRGELRAARPVRLRGNHLHAQHGQRQPGPGGSPRWSSALRSCSGTDPLIRRGDPAARG